MYDASQSNMFSIFKNAYISTIAYRSTPYMGDYLRMLEKKFEQNRPRTLREEAVERKKFTYY